MTPKELRAIGARFALHCPHCEARLVPWVPPELSRQVDLLLLSGQLKLSPGGLLQCPACERPVSLGVPMLDQHRLVRLGSLEDWEEACRDVVDNDDRLGPGFVRALDAVRSAGR